jgi:hypothetical protein
MLSLLDDRRVSLMIGIMCPLTVECYFLRGFIRMYTNSLVLGVSGNNYLSFPTYDEAQVYYTANRNGRRVVRTSEQDEATFGSLEEADDVNWRGY